MKRRLKLIDFGKRIGKEVDEDLFSQFLQKIGSIQPPLPGPMGLES